MLEDFLMKLDRTYNYFVEHLYYTNGLSDVSRKSLYSSVPVADWVFIIDGLFPAFSRLEMMLTPSAPW